MKKRKILRSIALFACVAAVLVLPGCGGNEDSGDKTYTLKYSVMEAPGTPMGEMAARIVDKVAERSGGKVILDPYYSGQLGDYIQVYEEVQMGTIDVTSQSIPAQYDDRLNITCVPYSVTSYDQVEKIWLDGGFGQKVLSDIYHDQKMELLTPIPYGFMGIGGSKLGSLDTILDPGVTQDCLVRVPVIDTYIAMGQAMGFRTTTLPYGDLYTALQSGVADGWMGGTAYVSWTSFKDVISQYVDAKYVHEICMSAMNLQTYESLPEEYQTILREVFSEEAKTCGREINQLSETAMKNMEDYGITVMNPTAEQLEPMAEHIRREVWPIYEDMLGKDLLDQYQAALKETMD